MSSLHWVHEAVFGGAKVSDLSDLGADPDQLIQQPGAGTNTQLSGLNALNTSESISASVAASQQDLLDSNAAHNAIINADQASIHAAA